MVAGSFRQSLVVPDASTASMRPGRKVSVRASGPWPPSLASAPAGRGGRGMAPRRPFWSMSARSSFISRISRTCDTMIWSASPRTRGSWIADFLALLIAME